MFDAMGGAMVTNGWEPTVTFQTEIFELVAGDRWAWVPAGDHFPDMPDSLTGSAQLARGLYACAAAVARLMPKGEHPRFRLVARALPCGSVVGVHEWHASSELRQYVPSHAPWVLWDERCALDECA